MFNTSIITAILATLVVAPHAPGCLPAEGAGLVGRDGGEGTLSVLHEIGETSAEIFRLGRGTRGLSTAVTAIQRLHQVSYNCALCLASYVQCGALAGNCAESCEDFKSPQCKICVAAECGKMLLACTRARFELPTASTNTEV